MCQRCQWLCEVQHSHAKRAKLGSWQIWKFALRFSFLAATQGLIHEHQSEGDDE